MKEPYEVEKLYEIARKVCLRYSSGTGMLYDDYVQEFVLAALAAGARDDRRGGIRTLQYRRGIGAVKDYVRKVSMGPRDGRVKVHSLDSGPLDGVTYAEQLAGASDGPDVVVADWLGALRNDRLASMAYAYYVDGLTLDEVGAKHGCSGSGVCYLLKRVRNDLADLMEPGRRRHAGNAAPRPPLTNKLPKRKEYAMTPEVDITKVPLRQLAEELRRRLVDRKKRLLEELQQIEVYEKEFGIGKSKRKKREATGVSKPAAYTVTKVEEILDAEGPKTEAELRKIVRSRFGNERAMCQLGRTVMAGRIVFRDGKFSRAPTKP